MINFNMILIASFLFPLLSGVLLFAIKEQADRKVTFAYTGLSLVITGVLNMILLFADSAEVKLITLMNGIDIVFRLDTLGKYFMGIVSLVWILAGFFSYTYMKHEKNEKRYFAYYLIVFGVLNGLGAAGNLITMYAFYEFMTLSSFPLVLHNQKKESVMAALKYLFYSFFGAYMALFGLFFMCRYCRTLDFIPGGVIDQVAMSGHETLVLVCICLMIMGFSVKAGMFPLHAWLPAAHPVAPAPASAALSGIIVKGGVLAILRVIFYIAGPEIIRGTFIQYLLLTLSLVTVFMGSMLAYREKVLKKRLAYSTVSQLSYILFGIALLNPAGLTGSLLHMAAHAFIKCALFLSAGAIIFNTGCTRVDELRGIGKKMPGVIWGYTIVSLGLIGIPPTGGFISKWYLASGALSSGIKGFSYAGPIVLLISALLTAGYLLPVTINGFFPGDDYDYENHKTIKTSFYMIMPIIVLAILSVLIGMFPNGLTEFIGSITGEIFNTGF